MEHIKTGMVDSALGETACMDRALAVQGWHFETARQQAEAEGIILSIDHLAVFYFLRTFYVVHGWPENTHTLLRMIDREFAQQGGTIYLQELFPEGILTQGARLAGVPAPRNIAAGVAVFPLGREC